MTAGDNLRIWPPWEQSRVGLRGLAGYASRAALRAEGLVPARRPAGEDESVAAMLFDRLAKRRVTCRVIEDVWEDRQTVRDPPWILAEGGNCLDLSVLYAAASREMGMSPLLALTKTHAFVVLCRDRFHDRERDPATGDPVPFWIDGARAVPLEGRGVLELEDPAEFAKALKTGALIGVDCVKVTESGASFESARNACRAYATAGLSLLDVHWLQSVRGVDELPPADGWPTIRRYLPGGSAAPGAAEEANDWMFSAQWKVATEIRDRTGTVAIVADSGIGKSTIARYVAELAPNASGWFLNAADLQSLIDSLAAAELVEQGSADRTLDRPDREGLAEAARRRLERSALAWVVVLDNADGDPATLSRWMPRPRADVGQLVLVTSTNSAWQPPRAAHIALKGATPNETEKRLGTPVLSKLVKGRALLVTAFERLLGHENIDATAIAADAKDSAAEPTGPNAYWRALRGRAILKADGALRLCALAALLPPDHVPVSALDRVAGAAHGTFDALVERGLLTVDPLRRRARLHRLLGAAIRDDLAERDAGVLDDAAIAVATDEGLREHLERVGDLGLATLLLKRFEALDESGHDDQRLNDALLAAGRILEMRGDTAGSADAYARLRRRLDPERTEHHAPLAECLHAAARVVYRDAKRERPLREALQEADRALELAAGTEAVGRYTAMRGLILKELAAWPPKGKTQAEMLRAALDVLVEAHRLRSERLDDMHPEWVRSQYNLAGNFLLLAQAEPHNAKALLGEAERIYDDTAKRRERIFGTSVHPQIAPCRQGLGLVEYYRALLVADGGRPRSAHLRAATDHVVRALDQWLEIENMQDGAESRKAAGYLVKIAMARHVHDHATAGTVNFHALHRKLTDLTVDVVDELRIEQVEGSR